MSNKDFLEEKLKDSTAVFRFLYKRGVIHDIQKYGHISAFGFIRLLFKDCFNRLLFTYSVKSYLLEPVNKNRIRPWIWKRIGCDLGKGVQIGHNVVPDFGNPERIHLGDNVVLSNGVSILCHKRDVTNYKIGGNAKHLPFKYEDVIIESGCQIGLNCTILPGVTIGEGSIIGSCSLVTKDIPAWSIAVGSPAKVIRFVSGDNVLIHNNINGGGVNSVLTFPFVWEAA